MGANLVPIVRNFSIHTETFAAADHDVQDGCVTPGTHKLMRFDFLSHNIGDADLVVGAPADHPEWFVHSASHGHFHLKHFNEFLLLDCCGNQVTKGYKQAFCLIDIEHRSAWGSAEPRFTDCDTNQGISAGWADLYNKSLPCQFIVLDGVLDGDYILVSTTNAQRIIPEDNFADNTIYTGLRIAGDSVTERVCLSQRLNLVIADTGNFGNACIGSFVDEMLTLNNSGAGTLTVTDITSSSAEFLVPNVLSYPLTVEAGGSLQVPIRLQPTSFGPKSATITVSSDDPGGPRTVVLSGNAPFGKLAVSGSTYFGEVECGIAQKTFSICNVGECSLHVTSVDFKRKRRHFRLINNPFPARLRPGSCLGVVIQYKASCDPECCELVIESDDPDTPIKTLDVVAYTRCEKKCEREGKKCECCEDEHDGHEDEC